MELPKDVQAFVSATFSLDDLEEATLLLSKARIEDGTVPSPRLLRCAAFASQGSLKHLRRLTLLLAVDWRDVVMAGEHELQDNVTVRIRDLSQPLQV